MDGPAVRHASRLLPYSGTSWLRLRRAALVFVPVLALLNGGCAVSSMGSMFGGKRDEQAAFTRDDATGSVSARKTEETTVALPPEADLAYAKAAVAEVLARGGKDASAPWENPRTGARGTVTPIASAYSQEGATCRDFLASYVRGASESWMQGEACQAARGRWEVKSLRPWRRS